MRYKAGITPPTVSIQTKIEPYRTSSSIADLVKKNRKTNKQSERRFPYKPNKMIEESFLQIGERNGPRVAAAATRTGLPWRLPCIKHLQTRAESATELQTWKILAQTKPTFCHIRPAPTADHRHRKNREDY
jgi:hypothetical protein